MYEKSIEYTKWYQSYFLQIYIQTSKCFLKRLHIIHIPIKQYFYRSFPSNSTNELVLGGGQSGGLGGCILREMGTFCLTCYFEKVSNEGELTHETKMKRWGWRCRSLGRVPAHHAGGSGFDAHHSIHLTLQSHKWGQEGHPQLRSLSQPGIHETPPQHK